MKALKSLFVFAAVALMTVSAWGAPTEDLASWLHRIKDSHSWNTGDLARFAKEHESRIAANTKDYEARILHSATILAQLGESKTVADYAKKFGVKIDYLGMKTSGEFTKPSSWPAVNTLVDQFVKEAVPVMKAALDDLKAIPEDWTGSVLLSADSYPVDEDTAIDVGDVLYARAGLEASIGLAYFVQGYDFTVDYAKGKTAIDSRRTIEALPRAPASERDEMWESVPDGAKCEGGLYSFKVGYVGKKMYIRVDGEMEEVINDGYHAIRSIYLSMEDSSEELWGLLLTDDPDGHVQQEGQYTARVFNASESNTWWDWDFSKKTVPIKVTQSNGACQFEIDLSKFTTYAKAGVWSIDWGEVCLYTDWMEGEFYDSYFGQWYDGWWDCGWSYLDSLDDLPLKLYKLLTEQTKFMAKVRNASSLAMSKDWMSAALNGVLVADEKVRARGDGDDAMHFIEYDAVDVALIDRARNLTEKALAALDAPQGVDVQKEILNEEKAPSGLSLLPTGEDGLLQVYLGALFEGKITRDLLPTVQKGDDEGPVPVIETIKDPTLCGLLPDFTVKDWMHVLQAAGWAVAHQTVVVKLDGNGGQVKPSTLSLDYDEKAECCFYPDLPVPADRKGYLFVGWATAKTDGAEIRAGDEYNASLFAGAKTPTLYAQWIKLYKVTLKDADAEAGWDWAEGQEGLAEITAGAEFETELPGKGTLMVPPGADVRIFAPYSMPDKKNKELVFQKWTVTPATADFGAGFAVGGHSTGFTMPEADVSFTASYIDADTTAGLIAFASADSIDLGWDDELGDYVTIEPPCEAFEWSPDGGKTWYKSGTSAMLKAGSYAVSWRSTDPQWSAPATSKTKTKLEVGDFRMFEGDSTFTYIPQVVVDIVTCEGGKALDSSAGGTVTMNPKGGLVPLGKSVTLTAKAAKNYAFQGWCYYRDSKKWKYGDGFGSTASATKIENSNACCCGLSCGGMLERNIDPADGKVHVKAVFKALSDYKAEGIVFAGVCGNTEAEVKYDGRGNAAVDLYGMVGCVFGGEDGYSIDCDPAASPLTFKLAKGGKLPAGLKFDAKTGVFSGVPTKAGDAVVAIVAVDPAKNEKSLAVTIHIRELPTWLVGDYRALTRNIAYDGEWVYDEASEGYVWVPNEVLGVPNGLAEISVAASGKVSAKYLTRGGTASFSGNIAWEPDEDDIEADGRFSFSKEDRNGWADIEFNADGSVSGDLDMDFKNGKEMDYVEGEVFGLRQDKELLAKSSFLEKYHTFAFGNETGEVVSSGYGYLTIKTDMKGGAKVTGLLPDGQKLSLSGLLLPQTCCGTPSSSTISAVMYLFASPSAYNKKGWFASALTFSPDGTIAADPEMSAWLPDGEGEEEEENDEVAFDGKGALYSEAKSLEGYYWNIICNYSVDVTADYVNKVSDELEAPTAEPLGDDDPTFFDVFLKGTAKGEITLAAKSPAPWNDGKKWHFDADKKGGGITDPSQLSFSFAKATGIFSGKATAYFDYVDQNTDKTVLKTAALPFNGVVITTPTEDGVVREGFGAAVYSGKSFEKNENTGKWKEIKTTVSLPVTLQEAEESGPYAWQEL